MHTIYNSIFQICFIFYYSLFSLHKGIQVQGQIDLDRSIGPELWAQDRTERIHQSVIEKESTIHTQKSWAASLKEQSKWDPLAARGGPRW